MTATSPAAARPMPRRGAQVARWALVAALLGGDLAAFYAVLALLYRAEPVILAAGTLGFVTAAGWAPHQVGVLTRRLRTDPGAAILAMRNALAIAWLAVGLAGFLARLVVAGGSASTFGTTPSDGPGVRDLAIAVLFLTLYLVAGLLTATLGHDHDPRWDELRAAEHAHRRAAALAARRAAHLTLARHVLAQHVAETGRQARRLTAARQTVLGRVAELQNGARLRMAAMVRRPGGTDGLAATGPAPLPDPARPRALDR